MISAVEWFLVVGKSIATPVVVIKSILSHFPSVPSLEITPNWDMWICTLVGNQDYFAAIKLV